MSSHLKTTKKQKTEQTSNEVEKFQSGSDDEAEVHSTAKSSNSSNDGSGHSGDKRSGLPERIAWAIRDVAADGNSDKAKDIVLDMTDHLLETISDPDQLQRVQPSASLSLFLTARWNFQPHLLTWLLIVFLLGFAPYYAIAGYSPGLLLVIPFGVGMSYALLWLVVYRVHAAAKFREQEENNLHVRMMGVATKQWDAITGLLLSVQNRIAELNKSEVSGIGESSRHSPTNGESRTWCWRPPEQSTSPSAQKYSIDEELSIEEIDHKITQLQSKVPNEVDMDITHLSSEEFLKHKHRLSKRLSQLRDIREALIRCYQHDSHELGPDIPCHSCEIFPIRVLRKMAHTPLRGFTGYLLGTTQDAHGSRLPAWAPVFIICGFFYIVGFLYVVEFRCAFIDWPTCGKLEELNFVNPCGGIQGISLEEYETDLQTMQFNTSYLPTWPMYDGFPVVYKREWFSALLSKKAAYPPFYVTIAVMNSQFIFYLVGCLVISTVLAWSTSPSAANLIQQQLKHHIHDLQKEEKAAQLKRIQQLKKKAEAAAKDAAAKGKDGKSPDPNTKTENIEISKSSKSEESDHESSNIPKDTASSPSAKSPSAKKSDPINSSPKKKTSESQAESASDGCNSDSEEHSDNEEETISLLAPPKPSKIKDAIERAKVFGSVIQDQSIWQQAWLKLMLSESANLPGCRDMFLHSDGMDGMRVMVADQEITTFVLERYLREERKRTNPRNQTDDKKQPSKSDGFPNSFNEIVNKPIDERRNLYVKALTYWVAQDPFVAEYTSLLNTTGQQLKRLRAWGINWLDDIDDDQFSLRTRRLAMARADMRQEQRYTLRTANTATEATGCLHHIHGWAQGRMREDLMQLRAHMHRVWNASLAKNKIKRELNNARQEWAQRPTALGRQLVTWSDAEESPLTMYILSIIRSSLIHRIRGNSDLGQPHNSEEEAKLANESLLNELKLTQAAMDAFKDELPDMFNKLREIAESVDRQIWPSDVKRKMVDLTRQLRLKDTDIMKLLVELSEEELVLDHIEPIMKAQVQREMLVKQEAEWVASNEQNALPSIASWNIASLIIALVVGWFQPVWNLTSNASMMHSVDIALNIISVFFNVPMLFLVCRTLRHPFLCYIESHYLMLGLMHTKLNLADESGNELKVWKMLRHHLVHHRGRQLNGLAQWSLFISLSVGACLTLMIVLTIVLGGSIKVMFTSYDGLIQVIGAVGLLGFSFGMVKTAVGVWTTQQEHCRMLQEVRFRVSNGRFKAADFEAETASFMNVAAVQKLLQKAANKMSKQVNKVAQSSVAVISHSEQGAKIAEHGGNAAETIANQAALQLIASLTRSNSKSNSESEAASVNMDGMTPGAQALCKSFTELIESIQEHDVAPAAFGLQMKPTLLQVLYGYVGTAVVAIFSRYVVSSFT